MQYRTLCGLSAALIIASSIAALETTHIDLREGSTNDGTVSISRAGGELLFDDAATSPPVSLQTLLSVTSDHSTLTWLESDSQSSAVGDKAAHGRRKLCRQSRVDTHS